MEVLSLPALAELFLCLNERGYISFLADFRPKYPGGCGPALPIGKFSFRWPSALPGVRLDMTGVGLDHAEVMFRFDPVFFLE